MLGHRYDIGKREVCKDQFLLGRRLGYNICTYWLCLIFKQYAYDLFFMGICIPFAHDGPLYPKVAASMSFLYGRCGRVAVFIMADRKQYGNIRRII